MVDRFMIKREKASFREKINFLSLISIYEFVFQQDHWNTFRCYTLRFITMFIVYTELKNFSLNLTLNLDKLVHILKLNKIVLNLGRLDDGRSGFNISWGSYNLTYLDTLAALYPTNLTQIESIHTDKKGKYLSNWNINFLLCKM